MKLLGAALVVLASCVVGFGFAGSVRAQMRQMEALLAAVTTMKSEIIYRMTPLEALLDILCHAQDPVIGDFFENWKDTLYHGEYTTVQRALHQAVRKTEGLDLTDETVQTLDVLAGSLGKSDVEGQCAAIDLALEQLRLQLQYLQADSHRRVRSYRTISVCTGLALAVILL